MAAIAFDRPANVVDGNVERVMARLHAVETPLPAAKPELKALAGDLVAADRPGDWAQALMDLGAVVCRPRAPLCDRCPVSAFCAARKAGTPDVYPRKSEKAERPRRHGAAYVLTSGGQVALVRRPPRGLLGGMLGLPTSDWRPAPFQAEPPATAAWRPARRRGARLHPLRPDPAGLARRDSDARRGVRMAARRGGGEGVADGVSGRRWWRGWSGWPEHATAVMPGLVPGIPRAASPSLQDDDGPCGGERGPSAQGRG